MGIRNGRMIVAGLLAVHGVSLRAEARVMSEPTGVVIGIPTQIVESPSVLAEPPSIDEQKENLELFKRGLEARFGLPRQERGVLQTAVPSTDCIIELHGPREYRELEIVVKKPWQKLEFGIWSGSGFFRTTLRGGSLEVEEWRASCGWVGCKRTWYVTGVLTIRGKSLSLRARTLPTNEFEEAKCELH